VGRRGGGVRPGFWYRRRAMPTAPFVDARAVVAEIEATVARRKAAGEYPEALLDRLSSEFHIVRDDEPVEALAYIQTHRGPVNRLPVVGRGIVFSKRLIRRAVAWYVQPIALQQTSFNLAVVRELREVQRRVDRLETPWRRPTRAPVTAATPALVGGRVDAMCGVLTGRGGRTLLLPGLDQGLHAALFAAVPGLGDRAVVIEDDPVLALRTRPSASLDAIIAPATLAMLTAADLLETVVLAGSRLAVGGVLVADAPQAAGRSDPSDVDPALRRWLSVATVTVLCEAAGLVVESTTDSAGGWCTVVAARRSR